MSAGICSLQALSKIELGLMGVSSATFQTLMERAGASCKSFPLFANRMDFEIYYALKLARTYLDINDFSAAYERLIFIQQKKFAANRLNYQEWLLLVALLKTKSHCGSAEEIQSILIHAITITKPDYEPNQTNTKILSKTEYEILILLSFTHIELDILDFHLENYASLLAYSDSTYFSNLEKYSFIAELTIAHAKYCIRGKKYEEGIRLVQEQRLKVIHNADYSFLLELTFLLGLLYLYQGEKDLADHYLKAAIYSAHLINNSIYSYMVKFCQEHTDYVISKGIESLPAHTEDTYCFDAYFYDYSSFSDGIFNQDSPDVYTINDVIYETRLDNNIPQQKLCQGLCSKSKLSKIENRLQQPSLFLTEALLQRLGISERLFTFWGNSKEAKYYDMKFKLIHYQLTTAEERQKNLETFSALVDASYPLPYQFFMTMKALYAEDYDEKINLLKEALYITQPNFDFYKISLYLLSWIELTILNSMARSYVQVGYSFYSLLLFQQLIEYQKVHQLDILLRKNIFPFTNTFYVENLYKEGKHTENVEFFASLPHNNLNLNINLYSFLLFYVAQSYGELGQKENCIQQAIYCVHLNHLLELKPNAKALVSYLYNDFGIQLVD